MLVARAPGSSVRRVSQVSGSWELKRFRTMVRLVQAITVCSREMRRAIRAGTTRLGPVVMK